MPSNKILITGSSGYVASNLIPQLEPYAEIYGLDTKTSSHTNFQMDIASDDLINCIGDILKANITVINLAAARFDFGATATEYYNLNVTCHKKFLENLVSARIDKFIHISSVAAIDGRKILFSENLGCDDAYRATKYLQEEVVRKWCKHKNIELIVLYPSAIFSSQYRTDTNIGKLQKLSRYIPFIPSINVKKSLTFLPDLSRFIKDSFEGKIQGGNFLTINGPVLTVTQMMEVLSPYKRKVYKIPFLRILLIIFSNFLYLLSGLGRIDLKLMPNRVIKLFEDTSYDKISVTDIDTQAYMQNSKRKLTEILLDNVQK